MRATKRMYTSTGDNPPVRSYPGLGEELRSTISDCELRYPIGAQHNHADSWSELLPVRELAMMSIMDKITDKVDWNKKIFDKSIVSKWREEALAIPDDEFWKLAIQGKYANTVDGIMFRSEDDHHALPYMEYPPSITKPEDIMDSDSFDYVRRPQPVIVVETCLYYRVRSVCQGTPREGALFRGYRSHTYLGRKRNCGKIRLSSLTGLARVAKSRVRQAESGSRRAT